MKEMNYLGARRCFCDRFVLYVIQEDDCPKCRSETCWYRALSLASTICLKLRAHMLKSNWYARLPSHVVSLPMLSHMSHSESKSTSCFNSRFPVWSWYRIVSFSPIRCLAVRPEAVYARSARLELHHTIPSLASFFLKFLFPFQCRLSIFLAPVVGPGRFVMSGSSPFSAPISLPSTSPPSRLPHHPHPSPPLQIRNVHTGSSSAYTTHDVHSSGTEWAPPA